MTNQECDFPFMTYAPTALVQRFDLLCARMGKTRSAGVRDAMAGYIRRHAGEYLLPPEGAPAPTGDEGYDLP